MKVWLCTAIFLFAGLSGSCQNTNEIFIVRHAEKSTEPASNPLLSNEGKQRAEPLKALMKDKNIQAIFSTATARTKETATPLSNLVNIPIEYYGHDTLSAFLQKVIQMKKNVLIVGHSNTILPMLDELQLSHNMINIADTAYIISLLLKQKITKL